MILELNQLLDEGKHDSITFEEMRGHIKAGTVLRFLEERAGDDLVTGRGWIGRPYSGFEEFYVKRLQGQCEGLSGDESRKFAISKKGLCLLLGMTTEILQEGTGWRRPKEYPA